MNGRDQAVKTTLTANSPLVELRGVVKSYEVEAGRITVLRGLDLAIRPGEFVAIVGRSGSGKSTLLNLLGALDRPSAGEVLFAGKAVQALSEDEASAWRGVSVGIVFQFFQLLPTLTVLENVRLPMDFGGAVPARVRQARALSLLARVGVTDQADKLPAQLSGGQQQRVAIARALANDPPLILADEPTGNLDSATAEGVLQLFSGLAREGKAVVMVTHERDLSAHVSRFVRLADGVVAGSQAGCVSEVADA